MSIEKFSNYNEVAGFPIEVFPPSIIKFVKYAAISLNCNVEFLCVPILIASSVAIGSKVKVQPKKSWTEGALLYAIVVGEPGSKKSPAIKMALAPIFDLQKSFLNSEEFRIIYTTDSTIESVAELMSLYPHGLLLYKDEAVGWWKGFNQYKSSGGNEMEYYLQIFSQTTLVITRKGKPPIQINNPFVSVIGGIQVDLLESLSEMRDNGFLDRILFSYPRKIKIKYTTEEIDEEITNEYNRIITQIYNSQQASEEKVLLFSTEAQLLWNDWNTEFSEKRNDDSLPYYFLNALSKLEAYTARFALNLEYLKCADAGIEVQCISIESLEGAIKLTNYFISNVQKVRDSFASSLVEKKIDKMVSWLRKQKNGCAKARTVYTNRVAGLKSANEVYDIFCEMKAKGIGQIRMHEDVAGGNQKTHIFTLNPEYLNNNQNQKSHE